MNLLDSRFVFNVAATIYDVFTSQEAWRDHCRRLSPEDSSPETILDVGCGPGISAFELEKLHPDATIVGIDIARKMIRRAQNTGEETNSSVNFLIGNAETLPVPKENFDLITGHSFLYLLDNREIVLEEIYETLTPDGQVTFLEPRKSPGFDWVLPSIKKGPRFFSTMIGWQIFSALHERFTPAKIEDTFRTAGFSKVTYEVTLDGLGWLIRANKQS